MAHDDVSNRPVWPIDPVDPYPELDRLAEAGPVHRLDQLDGWLVVSYDVVQQVLKVDGWSADPAASPAAAARIGASGAGAGADLAGRSVLFTDGEQHHRLRGALSGLLTLRAVEGFRERIEAVADAAVGAVDVNAPWDLMEEVAYTVPLGVICELLDTGIDLAWALRDETPVMTALLDPLATPAELEKAGAAAVRLTLDVTSLVADRVGRPAEDLLTQVVGRLETEEALVMTLILLAAGHETTASLIGNAAVVLHDHPDVARRLRSHPDLVPRAVEELLRYEPPVQLTVRVATQSHRLGGAEIEPGDQVFLSLAAANRDLSAFDRPDVFDPLRTGPPHVSFGHGPHFCAGAALARAEAVATIRRLVELDPPIEECRLEVRRARSATFRRIESLVVSPPDAG